MQRHSNGMSGKRQVTITHVARAAHVSTQTVSRVINNRPDVAPGTRQRVLQAIEQLGYRPNALARSLIQQRSHTLGVVAMPGDYYGPSRTLVGIEQQTRDLNYSLLLDLLHHPETADVGRILNRLLSRQVDGIVWAVPEIGNNRDWLEEGLAQLSVPVVLLNMAPRPHAASVSIDNREGGRQAAEHLLSHGYRNIGIITGPEDWWEARQRQLGWQDALQATGTPAGERQVVHGNWSAESGAAGLQQLLLQFPQADAVFASNDQMALGVLQAASRRGRAVPSSLGVVGFDDIPESAFFSPTLTTVRQPLIELGCAAVKALARLIEAGQEGSLRPPVEALTFSTDLVVRESSIRR